MSTAVVTLKLLLVKISILSSSSNPITSTIAKQEELAGEYSTTPCTARKQWPRANRYVKIWSDSGSIKNILFDEQSLICDAHSPARAAILLADIADRSGQDIKMQSV